VSALTRRIPRGLTHIAFFDDLFSRVNPRALLVTSEYSGVSLAATIAAKSRSIPVVAVQHGVIWDGHPAYGAHGGPTKDLGRPDVCCVYGDFEREILVRVGGFSESQVVVTGSPRYDLVKHASSSLSRAALVQELGLDPARPLLLFTSSGWYSRAVAARLAQGLAEGPPLSLIVKPHPIAEDDPDAFQQLLARHPDTVRLVEEDFDLYDLLRAVDVHGSTNSTVLSEAVLFDKPNVMVCTDLATDTVRYIERGVALDVAAYRSLHAAVSAAMAASSSEAAIAARQRFREAHFFKLDGNASRRIARVVMSQAESKR
jgi:CDP-glycerol glycerophosphotransferase (TagB/SpsB family)